ncbi:MAG TPA: maleylpyruvate isomerase N-terminal domain-containing protein [Streptosporangiaceae bacterium]|nr:maleylpyruvate isomerase N-terminal domain-containing protein [Streptosporangiaceae bacterium]
MADIVVPGDGLRPLAAIYGQLTVVADALTESSALLPSRCAGWAVTDVLYHQLMDARGVRGCRPLPGDHRGPPGG